MFKVGDKVRIVKRFYREDGVNNPYMIYFADAMIRAIGKIGVIVKEGARGRDTFHVDTGNLDIWIWVSSSLELVDKKPLRDANGRFKKADDAVAKGVVAEPAIMPVAEPVKPLPKPIVKPPLDIRAELTKIAGNGTCNYAIEFTNSAPRYQANDACHARLCWNAYYENKEMVKGNEIKNIALVIVPHYNNMFEAERLVYYRFVHYILNKSPWASCFITKNVDEAIIEGILMDVHKNVSHLVGAAMALRMMNEHKSCLEYFGKTLDAGYSGDVAFLVSGSMNKSGTINWPGHAVLCSSLDYREVAEFFKKGYRENPPGIYNDQKQTRYKVWMTICKTDAYGTGEQWYLSKFAAKHAVLKKIGTGFAARTEWDLNATMIGMANAFTKLLEK